MEPTQPEPNGIVEHVEPMAAAPVPSRARKLFLGPNGLRAGWRVLIFVLVFIAIGAAIRQARRAIYGPPPRPAENVVVDPQHAISLEARIFLVLVLATLVMATIEKHPMRWYGIGMRPGFVSRFAEGCVWGFASLSVLLLLLRLTGAFYFGDVVNHGGALARYAALWGVAFVLVGLSEEYLFRGYLQYTLTTGMGFWRAAVLLSGLFALSHVGNPGETWIGILDVFLSGIMLAFALQRTGDLWFPIGLHAAWDWGESFFYGVADSGMKTVGTYLSPHVPQNKPWWLTGGTVGPEGSILSACLEIVVVVLLAWRFGRANYPEGIVPVRSAPPSVEDAPSPQATLPG